MSYTIGLQVVNNDGTKTSGLFVIGDYGFPYILRFYDGNKERQIIGSDDQLYVFNASDDAVKAVRHFSKLYRYEFRERAKKVGVPVNQFKFFPVRIRGKYFTEKFALGDKVKSHSKIGGALYRIKYADKAVC